MKEEVILVEVEMNSEVYESLKRIIDWGTKRYGTESTK